MARHGTATLALRLTLLGAMAVGCGRSSGSGTPDENIPIALSPAIGAALPNAAVAQVYSQTFTVLAGGLPPYVIDVSGPGATLSPDLPPGLAFDGVATLSGTPTQVGSFTIQVSVTDAGAALTQVDYTLAVLPSLTISPATLPGGTLNASYSVPITVTGGAPPYSFGTQGGLPPGLSLTVGGQAVLSGTPTAPGTFHFTVTATDSSSPTEAGFQSYTLTIP